MKTELELYLHIPFCARKCAYCDFFSGTFCMEEMRRYFEDLRTEIRACREEELLAAPVRSIFIGGGTPSFVPEEEIAKTIRTLRECFTIPGGIEFTIEANPGTLNEKKLDTYLESGINRLSLGLQSPDNRMLEKLQRIHSFSDFLDSFSMARRAGFTNISVDLMSGLPGETPEEFEKGLKTVVSLQPEHLSVYSLIIEENTPFYALYGPSGNKREELPDEECDRRIYHRTKELLEEAGYRRYEISNYARPGFECIHNLGYWTGVPYLGFGASAASFTGRRRFKNASDLKYLFHKKEEEETLSDAELMSEYMILGLRLSRGVSENAFKARFGRNLTEVFRDPVNKHCALKTLIREDGCIRLSEYGTDVANAVMQDFLI